MEVVSVALDTGGIEAAGPWIDRAKTTHPALVDEAHLLDELLGLVNVPSGVWIDERGTICRPPEPAFPWRVDGRLRRLVRQVAKLDPVQLTAEQRQFGREVAGVKRRLS